MNYQAASVQMTQEVFDRSIKGTPKEAIKELIWNACDADAKNIEIKFENNGFDGHENITGVYITDDGHGIAFEEVKEIFSKYGNSYKSCTDKSPLGRIYHGKLGQGRYKALSVGNSIEWKTVYKNKNGKLLEYEIRISSSDKKNILFSEKPVEAQTTTTGTQVYIYGIIDDAYRAINKLADNKGVIPELLSTFASYLMGYNDISINYNGIKLEPENQIQEKIEEDIVFYDNDIEISAKVQIIKWKNSQINNLYLCGSSGVVFDEKEESYIKSNQLSAYILSSHFENLHQNNIMLFGMSDKAYMYFISEAKKIVRKFIKNVADEIAANEILEIKAVGAYPFQDEPETAVEIAQRSTFDLLAVQVNKSVPQLKSVNLQTKKLTYRLIKEAINTNPTSIQTILAEVFTLSKDQQDDLAELLQRTHLPEIINTTKIISDRLTFIYLLEQMVYNDSVGKPY